MKVQIRFPAVPDHLYWMSWISPAKSSVYPPSQRLVEQIDRSAPGRRVQYRLPESTAGRSPARAAGFHRPGVIVLFAAIEIVRPIREAERRLVDDEPCAGNGWAARGAGNDWRSGAGIDDSAEQMQQLVW